jgi:N6-adenosine-specific RNA methylase IME4
MSTDQALARIDQAKKALAEAKTLQEVKKIADMAEAARIYAQRSKAGKEVEMYAVEINLLAERRLGEMLKKAPKATGGQHGGKMKIDGSRAEPSNISPTLAELGIDKKLSSRAQTIAKIPEAKFKATIEAKVGNGTLSRSVVLKDAKREQKRADHAKFVENLILSGMRPGTVEIIEGPYEIIVADPPWRYSGNTTTPDRTIENQYSTATVEEIISHRPNSAQDAILFLWATAPLLIEALQVLNEWGFSYKTNAVWDKQKIGLGYWFRVQHEHLLVGTKGKVSPPAEEHRISSIFQEERTAHSKKPDSVYQWIEAAFPNKKKRLEMYARNRRFGWASWGKEIERVA